MADGFEVKETVAASPDEVWAYLTDFRRAEEWMTGIENMAQITPGPIAVGTSLTFKARGTARETRVTALDPGRHIALTSRQGGVTATYTYSLAPAGGGTEVSLTAVCKATGIWKALHPMIVFAMKRSDSSQLANLKLALENRTSAARR